ncbi:MAG: hypothetical protein SGARI_003509 [Bacillariaceae sp.]
MVVLAATAQDGMDGIPTRDDPFRLHALDENGGLRGARRLDLSSPGHVQIDDQDVVMDDDDWSMYESFDQLHFAKSLGFVLWDDVDSPDYSQGSSDSTAKSSSSSSSLQSKSKKSPGAPSAAPSGAQNVGSGTRALRAAASKGGYL